jgi:hypothetical protein
MWSPAFVPRCVDWPAHVDVVGDFTPISDDKTLKLKYNPDPKLKTFLDSCSENNKPIYIGFGSMVIEDSGRLVTLIKVRLKWIAQTFVTFVLHV